MARTSPEKWDTLLRRAVVTGCVVASFTVEDFSFNRLLRLTEEELQMREDALLKMIRI